MRMVKYQAPAASTPAEEKSSGAAFSALFWALVMGVYGPLIAVSMAVVVYDRREDETLAVFLLGGAVLCAVWILFATRLVARSPVVQRSLPLLRKLIWLVPASYVTAWAAFGVIALSLGMDSMANGMLGIAAAIIFLLAGSVAFLRQSHAWGTSAMQGVGILLGHAGLIALPLALIAFLFFGLVMARLSGVASSREKADVAFVEEFAFAVPADLDGGWRGSAGARQGTTSTVGNGLREPAAPKTHDESAPRVRRQFPETLYWQPQLVTDERGAAQLELPLADSITTWRLAGSAVSRSGQLGSFQRGIRVFQDFFIDIDFPAELTQNDEVSVPVMVYNYLDKPQTVRLHAKAGDWFELVDEGSERELQIAAGEVSQVRFPIRVLQPGRHALTIFGTGDALSDAVERSVRVRPDGERFEQVVNDRLSESKKLSVAIPQTAIDGGSDLFIKFYPGAFSQVSEGMDTIFRMPYGCFEQTSSTTYPNILALAYMRSTNQLNPEIEMKALNFINIGYQRLLSYEVDGGGFEWFGRPPAHNVLTAYGLMEFSDMAKVYQIDETIIPRTRDWLLRQMKSDGTFRPAGGIAEGAINAFQGETLRTTAYIAWAIAQAGGGDGLEQTFDYLIENHSGSDDPYALGLCVNAFATVGRGKEAASILHRLDAMKSVQGEFVFWTPSGGGGGLMHSRGETFTIETTALVAQAMQAADVHRATVHRALAWLVSMKDPNGTWRSTQATVQTMRALLAGANPASDIEGKVTLTISANEQNAGTLEITEENSEVFHLFSLTPFVRRGVNEVDIRVDGSGNLACQLVAVHHMPRTTGRPHEPLPILQISTDYSATELKERDLLEVEVTLRYHRPDAAPMTLVDLGIPPGFEVQVPPLEGLVRDGTIRRFTHNGRQLTFYFESIPGAGKPLSFKYALKAKFPVKAKAPGATVYQYYEPEVRDQSEPVEITVSRVDD